MCRGGQDKVCSVQWLKHPSVFAEVLEPQTCASQEWFCLALDRQESRLHSLLREPDFLSPPPCKSC